jgi:gluconolactonase
MAMMTSTTPLLLVALLALLPTNRAADPGDEASPVTEPGAQLQRLASDFKFTEGPSADVAGNVFFTDQPNDRILRWGLDGKLSTFLQPAGRANGMCFEPAGMLIVCADEKNQIWTVTPDAKATAVPLEYQGKPMNGPNDVWVHPNGNWYFTDPFYQRPWWTHTQMPQDGQHVYLRPKNGTNLVRVTDDLRQPNGIVGTPDGKTLFVADIGAGKTYRYAIQPDGRLAQKQLFCSQGSDGMTLDRDGHIFLTGRGVAVYDSTGKKIQQIDVPENWTANVCFGGVDRRTLFITASKGLYAIRTRVAGTNQGK